MEEDLKQQLIPIDEEVDHGEYLEQTPPFSFSELRSFMTNNYQLVWIGIIATVFIIFLLKKIKLSYLTHLEKKQSKDFAEDKIIDFDEERRIRTMKLQEKYNEDAKQQQQRKKELEKQKKQNSVEPKSKKTLKPSPIGDFSGGLNGFGGQHTRYKNTRTPPGGGGS